jgi:voltage-gated potassium channel
MSSKLSRSSRFVRKARFRLRYALYAVLAAVALGTLGFHLLEGWSLPDSLYATIQTLTTVGYGDLTPTTSAGRLFASIYMIVGVGAVLYVLTATVKKIVQSEMVATFGDRRRQREMSKLHDHFIICGAGRVGSRLIRELQRASVPFAVIEKDEQRVAQLIESGAHVIVGDATLEETLREVGVDRARGLAACLADDAGNVYVVLIARDLNHNLHIVARAVEEQAEPKLIKAGANRVVAPTITGSHRMAQALMRPAVADFMDSIAAENLDLNFEEMEVAPNSVYAGHKLRYTNILSELNVIIVAIRRRNGQMNYNPTGDALIHEGDILISIGRAESLTRMSELARGMKQKSDS